MPSCRHRVAVAAAIVGVIVMAQPVLAQDVTAGQRVFNQCRACHTINEGGRNGVGPNLHGVIGRRAASVEGFRYSKAMQEKGEDGWTWTAENLRPYLRSPKDVVPGTNMTFPGIRNEQQLNDVIAYIESQS